MQEAAHTAENAAETAPSGPSQCPFCRYLVGSKTRATICPECGKPLEPPLDELLLEGSSFGTLRRLRLGLAAVMLVLAPLYVAIYLAYYFHLTVKAPVAIGVALMAGWLPLCATSPLRWEFARERQQRKMAAAATILVALMLALLLFAVVSPMALRRAVHGSLTLALIGLSAIPPVVMAQFGLSFHCLAVIADRIPDPKIASGARMIGTGWMAASAGTLVGLIALGVGQIGPLANMRVFELPIFIASILVVLPVSVLTLFYYPMLTWKSWKRLGQVTRMKRFAQSGQLRSDSDVAEKLEQPVNS